MLTNDLPINARRIYLTHCRSESLAKIHKAWKRQIDPSLPEADRTAFQDRGTEYSRGQQESVLAAPKPQSDVSLHPLVILKRMSRSLAVTKESVTFRLRLIKMDPLYGMKVGMPTGR